jgi:hypothetical protein
VSSNVALGDLTAPLPFSRPTNSDGSPVQMLPSSSDYQQQSQPDQQQQQQQQPQQAQQQGQQQPGVEFQDCDDSHTDAQKSCTTQDMTAGMNPQQMQQAQQMQQQAQQANQNAAGGGNNSGQQCKNQADLSKILAGLSALKGGACTATVSDCKDTCKKYVEQNDSKSDSKTRSNVSKAKRFMKLCDAYAPNSTAAFAQAAGMLANMFMNQKCAEQSATASPTPTAMQDCTNPTYAKTNIMCICQNDPKSAMCQAGQQFPTGLQTSNGNTGPGTPAYGTDTSTPSDGAALLGDGGKAKGASGSATTGEGGGGGGLQGGRGGAAANNGGDGGGYGPSGINTGVITGTANGGGAGAASAPGGGGGAGGGGGGGRNRTTASDFDLSKFLPKGKTKNYGGQSITAKDGITGPMGPSIWEKVSNQYQLQKPNLVQGK